MELFEDELGSVKIFSTYIERERDEDVWEDIEESISGIVIDKIHFSQVEKIQCQSESAPPMIEIKIESGWRKMPFSNAETCKDVFKRSKYYWNVFNQNF